MLGLSGLQLLYGPTRIQGPLKRVGERGQGRFKSITWRQAIKEVADKLADIRS
jgi:anaerobic selenocysteine-containing dehydrogenase